jgi:hypothetical protein
MLDVQGTGPFSRRARRSRPAFCCRRLTSRVKSDLDGYCHQYYLSGRVRPMQIEADIKRSDIFRTIIFHGRSRSWLLSICLILYGVLLWSQWHGHDRPEGWQQIVYVLEYYGVRISGLFCVLVLYVAIVSVFLSKSAIGVIGIHKFEIKNEGFYEETIANQTLAKWISIKKVVHDKHQIVVWVSSWTYYVVPRRSFKTKEEYASFYDELLKHSRKTA